MVNIFGNTCNKLEVIAIVMSVVVLIAGYVVFYSLSIETIYNDRRYMEQVNLGILIIGIIAFAIVSYIISIRLYTFGELVECATHNLIT